MFGGRLEGFFTVPTSVTISVTNNGGGPTTVAIAAGSYTPTSFIAYLQSALTAQRAPGAGAWTVTLSTGASGTGLVTIAMTAGTFSITWTSTLLRDLLGYTATITTQTSVSGTKNMCGLWLPDSELNVKGHPSSAPVDSDLVTTESPTGDTVSLVGAYRYEHKELRWSHVPVNRTVEYGATTARASWQQWVRDTQLGFGHAWFSPGSRFQAFWDNQGTDSAVGLELGASGPTTGWAISPPMRTDSEFTRTDTGWYGMWSIEIPRIVSSG